VQRRVLGVAGGWSSSFSGVSHPALVLIRTSNQIKSNQTCARDHFDDENGLIHGQQGECGSAFPVLIDDTGTFSSLEDTGSAGPCDASAALGKGGCSEESLATQADDDDGGDDEQQVQVLGDQQGEDQGGGAASGSWLALHQEDRQIEQGGDGDNDDDDDDDEEAGKRRLRRKQQQQQQQQRLVLGLVQVTDTPLVALFANKVCST
jgi:hypothetical protein